MPSLGLSAFETSNLKLDAQPIERLCLHVSPVELLVPKKSRKRIAKGYLVHSFDGELPRKSILGITESVYVASPELCFLQLVATLDIAQLALLGCELCGYYSIRPYPESGMIQRLPLTSKARLSAYLEKCGNAKGVKAARQAVELIADGSASPRETAVYALLCFPRKYGGFGLPKPCMNKAVMLSAETAQAFGASYYVGDMVWPDRKVIVEYDGIEGHAGRDRIAHDARRRDALLAEGYSVFVITAAHLSNAEEFRIIAHAVARKLRANLRIRSEAFPRLHQLLRDAVL